MIGTPFAKSLPTPRQIEVFEVFTSFQGQRGPLSRTAEKLGISPANVLKAIKGLERKIQLQSGLEVPEASATVKRRPTLLDADGRRIAYNPCIRLATVNGHAIPELVGGPVRVPSSFDDKPFADNDDGDEKPEARNIFATGHQVVRRRIIGLPAKGVLTLVMTSAQDGTAVHNGFWSKLNSYVDYKRGISGGAGAELIVSGFTYNKKMFGSFHEKTSAAFLSAEDLHEMDDREMRKLVYFDDRIEGYWSEDRIELEDRLDLCAEINTLPTAVNPLSGFQTYTNGRWGIFPHAKQHLESVARMPGKPYKANVTTGSCTVPNYVAKKAGQKAEMHHTIGAVIVECLPDGRFWVRTITADPETGNFYDLDCFVDDDGVHKNRPVATISYGDIHHEKVDPEVARATWGYFPEHGTTVPAWSKASLLERLKPQYQFFHDVSDFAPRNHHNIADPHFLAMTYFRREASVEHELRRVARFLGTTSRPWCKSVVVQSNHDNAFLKWLKTAEIRWDPENAELYHRSQAIIYKSLRETGQPAPIFEVTLRDLAETPIDEVQFIDEQDSFEVHGIEHSQHGHLGPNGSRGSPLGLSKVAPKMTTGHTHSPCIRDGLFVSGACAMEMGYNRGPTSWAIAHTIGHHDGNRQILFFDGGAFHA